MLTEKKLLQKCLVAADKLTRRLVWLQLNMSLLKSTLLLSSKQRSTPMAKNLLFTFWFYFLLWTWDKLKHSLLLWPRLLVGKQNICTFGFFIHEKHLKYSSDIALCSWNPPVRWGFCPSTWWLEKVMLLPSCLWFMFITTKPLTFWLDITALFCKVNVKEMVIYKLYCKESATYRQILGGQRDLSKHSNVKNEEHRVLFMMQSVIYCCEIF